MTNGDGHLQSKSSFKIKQPSTIAFHNVNDYFNYLPSSSDAEKAREDFKHAGVDLDSSAAAAAAAAARSSGPVSPSKLDSLKVKLKLLPSSSSSSLSLCLFVCLKI
jgi:hypothetical protein